MKYLLSSVVFFAALNAHSAQKVYDLKLDIFEGTKKLSSVNVPVKNKETVTINNDGTFIEIQAQESWMEGLEGVEMKVVFGKIDADGTRKILGRPQVVTRPNEQAKFTVEGEETGNYSLSIVAKENTSL